MTWFEIIAGVASIIGLVFSVFAFLQARSAKVAAKEAKEATLRNTLSDELEVVCVRLDQLPDFIEHDRYAEAGLRASELQASLSELPFRRGPFLTVEIKDELLNVREQLGILVETIRQGQMSALKKQRILKVSQGTAVKLRENLGKMKADMDTGERR